ncbi:MAG: DUF3800 domain-containing protein [Methanobrevibacter sp.]|nr:DUF3800 domain-containing protein [Methanobrevibacter sp.]
MIFGDESGDLGLKGSHYFILSSVIFSDENEYKKLKYLLKNVRRHKFHKILKTQKEIKGYKSSDELIFYLFEKSEQIDFKAYSIVFDKKEITNRLMLNNHNQYSIYSKLVFKLLKGINLKNNFNLILDQFILPTNEKDFKKTMIDELGHLVHKSKIHHSNSEKWKGIQFADLIAWSCFQRFERNKTKYLEKLKDKHENFYF